MLVTVRSKDVKSQFIASEDMEIVLPPFYDKSADVYITTADVVTLVVVKPNTTVLSPVATVARNANTDHWEGTIAAALYEQGQWLIKATSDAANTLAQYLVLTWGDYVDEIRQAVCGRWLIENNQLMLYEDDGLTPLKTFDLKDSEGQPTSTRIFERDPV